MLHGHVGIGQGLGLDSLAGIHQEHRALAGGQGARHFIAEVHVTRCVDEVERVGGPIQVQLHAHRVRLDGDATLALQVHGIQHLIAHLARGQRGRALQHAIGQRGFAVVDVRDDAEVARARLIEFAAGFHV